MKGTIVLMVFFGMINGGQYVGRGFAAGVDDDRHGSSGDWILGTSEVLFLWQAPFWSSWS